MKTLFHTLLFVSLSVSSVAQELAFSLHGNYKKAITRESLLAAKSMNDLLPGYPSNWITSYNSVEIEVKRQDGTYRASGSNEQLSPDQIALLKTAELNSTVLVDIKYNYQNTLSGELEKNKIHALFTVIPESEAHYKGGQEELYHYLKVNCTDKITDQDAKLLRRTKVEFIVNEEGEIREAKLTESTGNTSVDKLLLEAVNGMPSWQAAEDATGKKVKQHFLLDFGRGNAGC